MNEAQLKPLLTPDFLNTLVEAARVCGWSVDYVEICRFVAWCHDLTGVPAPDLTPYEQEE